MMDITEVQIQKKLAPGIWDCDADDDTDCDSDVINYKGNRCDSCDITLVINLEEKKQ